MDLDALFITATWLTGNVSDKKSVGEVTQTGYAFHRIYKEVERIRILIRDSLKCETHLSFDNYQLTFSSGEISFHLAIIYRLHPTKKAGLKAIYISSVNVRNLVTILQLIAAIC